MWVCALGCNDNLIFTKYERPNQCCIFCTYGIFYNASWLESESEVEVTLVYLLIFGLTILKEGLSTSFQVYNLLASRYPESDDLPLESQSRQTLLTSLRQSLSTDPPHGTSLGVHLHR